MNKKYWLALGGWAARWLVHLGLIKFLSEKNIEISELAGTSMGSIIAGFLAIWKNFSEIRDFSKELDYKELIDFDLRYWLMKGDKMLEKLEFFFWDSLIEDTKIPLKIIATNFNTWEIEVFTKWKIADAIRASISIPSAIKPYNINGIDYLDGWMLCNLPVNFLDSENKIASSAIKIITGKIEKNSEAFGLNIKRGFVGFNLEIFTRSILYMMNANEKYCFDLATGNKQILRYNFGELDSIDFEKIDEFIELGYTTAKNNLKI